MVALAAREPLLLAAVDAHAQPIRPDGRSLAGREVDPTRVFIDAAHVSNFPLTLRDCTPLVRLGVERIQVLPTAALAENDDLILDPPRIAWAVNPGLSRFTKQSFRCCGARPRGAEVEPRLSAVLT